MTLLDDTPTSKEKQVKIVDNAEELEGFPSNSFTIKQIVTFYSVPISYAGRECRKPYVIF
jgi:hypothetical protein